MINLGTFVAFGIMMIPLHPVGGALCINMVIVLSLGVTVLQEGAGGLVLA